MTSLPTSSTKWEKAVHLLRPLLRQGELYDVNASYTFGKKFKTTFYAEANNLLNQPLRYYQGTKDRTMQAEYYGVKVNAGVKINF